MNEQEVLEEFGLSDKEAKIYLTLLAEKSATAAHLAKIARVNRTTAYLELDNLIKKGIVSYVIKDSRRYYQPASPEKFIEILDSKKAKFQGILPLLKGKYSGAEKFKIEVYEGKEGAKTFYLDILNNAKEVLSFGVTGKAFETMEFIFPHFLKQYKKKGIKARYLANANAKKLLEELPKDFVKIKYLPEKYNSDVTTIIYNNKVAIQSLLGDNIFVILIQDKKLYEGYKSYFEFMWGLTK